MGRGVAGKALSASQRWGNPTGTEMACPSETLQRTGKVASDGSRRPKWGAGRENESVWPAAATPGHTLVPSLCKDMRCFFLLIVKCGGKARAVSLLGEVAGCAGKCSGFGWEETSFGIY